MFDWVVLFSAANGSFWYRKGNGSREKASVACNCSKSNWMISPSFFLLLIRLLTAWITLFSVRVMKMMGDHRNFVRVLQYAVGESLR